VRRTEHGRTTDSSGTNDGRTTDDAWTNDGRMKAAGRPDLGNTRPVNQVAASLSGKARRSNSELYRWMWEYYDQLQTGREGRPDWVGATEQLTCLGMTDRNGGPLRPDNVRRVWGRVVRDRRAIAKSIPAPTPMPQPKPAPPPLPAPSFASEPVTFEFRTLRKTPIRKQE
jgi:hypothetical protein